MNKKEKNKRKQIQTLPKHFSVEKFFGPTFGIFKLPDDVVEALTIMTNTIINDPLSESYGKNLAGAIKQEKFLYKEDFVNAGVSQILENCIKSYIVTSAKKHLVHLDKYRYESMIIDAWVVSQYENEYNPIHNHTACDISAVLYLKTPNVKGRRGIDEKRSDNDGDINFIYGSDDRDLDILDKGIWGFTPEVGDLFIFPSYLLHTVYPFLGNEERRSLAFNAIYRVLNGNEILYGPFGSRSPKNYKYLESRP